MNSEARYDNQRIRMFTLFIDGSGFTVRIKWGKTNYQTIPWLVKYWTIYQVDLVLATNERWHYSLSSDMVKEKLKKWRQRAEHDGLTEVIKFKS